MYREPLYSARKNVEFWAGQRFRLRAHTFASKLPDWEDYLSWLFFMQHFGVATRLLDWSASVLVALYFATDDPNDGPPTTPRALIPPFKFPRMAAQISRFTIHPSLDRTAMIEFLLRSETCLVRYTVPAASKASLRKDLASLGVSHDTLHHSLKSLARTIKEEILEKDFQLTNPPNFKDE